MKKVKMTDELKNILLNNEEGFKKKFGRDPLPTDPVFYDPDFDTPTPITEEKLKKVLIEVANKAGIDASRVLKQLGFDVNECENSNIRKNKHN